MAQKAVSGIGPPKVKLSLDQHFPKKTVAETWLTTLAYSSLIEWLIAHDFGQAA